MGLLNSGSFRDNSPVTGQTGRKFSRSATTSKFKTCAPSPSQTVTRLVTASLATTMPPDFSLIYRNMSLWTPSAKIYCLGWIITFLVEDQTTFISEGICNKSKNVFRSIDEESFSRITFVKEKLHNLIILQLIHWTAKQSLNSIMWITPSKLCNQNLYL